MSPSKEVATENIPQVTFVYRFFNADDELLYVGISKEIEARFRQHAASKPWFSEVASSLTEQCPTLPVALAKEAKAILFESPKYNRSIPTMERHDVLQVRAGEDPHKELDLVDRLRIAEDANRRHALNMHDKDRLESRCSSLARQLEEERESSFASRSHVVKLSNAVRDSQRIASNAESQAAALRVQLEAARQEAENLRRELAAERAKPVFARAFARRSKAPSENLVTV